MSEEPGSLFDSIYERFLLRDFMGKVIPGLILLASVAAMVTPRLSRPPASESLLFVFGAFGFAWVVGLAIQSFGEWTGLVRYYPMEFAQKFDAPAAKSFYELLQECAKKESKDRQHLERLAVIKEACGNGAVALGMATAVVIVGQLVAGLAHASSYWRNPDARIGVFAGIVLMGLGALFLWRMHREHLDRQLWFMETMLDRELRADPITAARVARQKEQTKTSTPSA
jgi:hypothetical protein